MSEVKEKVDRLHVELATLYRGKSTDYVLIGQYWAQIEKLERGDG